MEKKNQEKSKGKSEGRIQIVVACLVAAYSNYQMLTRKTPVPVLIQKFRGAGLVCKIHGVIALPVSAEEVAGRWVMEHWRRNDMVTKLERCGGHANHLWGLWRMCCFPRVSDSVAQWGDVGMWHRLNKNSHSCVWAWAYIFIL